MTAIRQPCTHKNCLLKKTFLCPFLCKHINKSIARYWWGQKEDERRIHWVAWDTLIEPKEKGGLGFLDLEDFNDAMLAKQAWRLIEYPSSLLGKILKARYFRSSSFLDANMGSNPSWGWRSILHGRAMIKQNLRWIVGDGKKIRVWEDVWLPNNEKITRDSDVGLETNVSHVEDLMIQEPRRWDVAKIDILMSRTTAKLIKCIPLSHFEREDKLVWAPTNNGEYTVKSGYIEARKQRAESGSGTKWNGESSTSVDQRIFYKNIWNLAVPSKLKHFVWRCVREILPVQVLLAKKHVITDTTCIFCNEEEENMDHLFFRCPFARMVWYCSSLQIISDDYRCGSFMEWWGRRMEKWRDEQNYTELGAYAVYLLWSIWLARNNARFNNKKISPLEAADNAMRYASEFKDASSAITQIVSDSAGLSTSRIWSAPPEGVMKLNCDGSWIREEKIGGTGFVVRDHSGHVYLARAAKVSHAYSARIVEALAVRDGVMFCIQEGFRRLIIESDSKEIMDDVKKGGCIPDTISIVKDIILFSHQAESCNFKFVPQNANCVAHKLAAFGLSNCGNVATFSSVPEWLEQDVAQDQL